MGTARNPNDDYKNIRVWQASATVNGGSGTATPSFTNTIAKGLITRIIVERTAGDATNFGVEIRDDSSSSADDDNRWFYLASAARTKTDQIPDAKEYMNRDAPMAQTIYVLIPFSGGSAINQTYRVTIWTIDYGTQTG